MRRLDNPFFWIVACTFIYGACMYALAVLTGGGL